MTCAAARGQVLPELLKAVEFGGGGTAAIAPMLKLGQRMSAEDFGREVCTLNPSPHTTLPCTAPPPVACSPQMRARPARLRTKRARRLRTKRARRQGWGGAGGGRAHSSRAGAARRSCRASCGASGRRTAPPASASSRSLPVLLILIIHKNFQVYVLVTPSSLPPAPRSPSLLSPASP